MTVNTNWVGSDFDDFLREETIFEEVEAEAIKKVLSLMLEQAISEKNISKAEMARRMGTSRSQLDRLLDPNNHCVTLTTITRAASVLGKKVTIAMEDATTTHMA